MACNYLHMFLNQLGATVPVPVPACDCVQLALAIPMAHSHSHSHRLWGEAAEETVTPPNIGQTAHSPEKLPFKCLYANAS